MRDAGHDDEGDLCRRAVAGDHDALEVLLRRSAPELRRRLRGRIAERHRGLITVDDVVQDACTDAFVGIGRFAYRGPGSFGAWLESIAWASLMDAVRFLEARKRGGGMQRRADVSTLGSVSATPSRAAARGEALKALEAGLDALPEHYAAVVRGYDLEGRPIESVAEELGRSVGAVYLIRNRALRRLRGEMGGGSRFFSNSP